MMVVPSKLSVIRKAATFARARPTLFFLAGQRQSRGGSGRIHDSREHKSQQVRDCWLRFQVPENDQYSLAQTWH
jgi:hypothetical protein